MNDLSASGLASAFFDALNAHDARAAIALVAASARIQIIPANIDGTAAHEGQKFFDELIAAFPDLLIQVRSITRGHDTAVVEVKLEGTQAAAFLGVLNQQKHVDVDQAWLVHAAQGKIVGLRAYWCQNQLYRRLAVKRLDRISILGATP
jgi:hypothetical protein